MSSVNRKRVLVDGFSRDTKQGTGISTYSRILFDSLTSLGHSPTWLFGRRGLSSGDAVSSEVEFFDRAENGVGIVRAIQAAGRLGRGLISRSSRARYVSFKGVVISDPEEIEIKGAYNVPDLYQLALYRHELVGAFHEVKLPEAPEIFHLTAPLPMRVRGARTITTIHDLVPLRLPTSTIENKARLLKLLRTCVKHSDLIATVSEASKADIVELLDVDPARVEVTYQSTNLQKLSCEEQHSVPRVLARLGLEAGTFLLYVGAIEPKKNVRRLIDAFLEADTDQILVIAGKKAWLWDREIGGYDNPDIPRHARVRFLNYVSHADLRYLYSGATALVLPSLYEGFGLPVLEAMVAGCPVIASHTRSLKEVCGDAALHFDPYDRNDIRLRIEHILGDREVRKRLVELGHLRAEMFSRARYIERLGAMYDRLP